MLAVAGTHTCGLHRFHTLGCAATGLRSTYSKGSDPLKGRSKKSKPRRREVRATASALPCLQTPLGPIVAQDYVTAVAAAGAAYVWVRLFDWMASRGLLGQVTRAVGRPRALITVSLQTTALHAAELESEACTYLFRPAVCPHVAILQVGICEAKFTCTVSFSLCFLHKARHTLVLCAVQSQQLSIVQLLCHS